MFPGSLWNPLPTTLGNAGPSGPAGQPFTQGVTSIAAVAGGTITLAPAIGQDVLITMPATGGTVTLAAGTVAARQRVMVDIINGATLGTIVFGTGILIGSSSPTYAGAGPNTTDNIEFIAPGSTVAVSTLRLQSLNLGFSA